VSGPDLFLLVSVEIRIKLLLNSSGQQYSKRELHKQIVNITPVMYLCVLYNNAHSYMPVSHFWF